MERYTVEGGPWPDGPIRHVCTHAHIYTVTLRQVWTGRWRLRGGPWVQFPGARTVAASLGFPVDQIQSVRTR